MYKMMNDQGGYQNPDKNGLSRGLSRLETRGLSRLENNESVELTIVNTRPGTASIVSVQKNGRDIIASGNFGCFMSDGSRKIDFVLVYESKRETRQQIDRRQFFSDNLIKEGLELEYDHVTESGKTFIFIKLHAPWDTLCKLAEELELKMPLKIRDQPSISRNFAGYGERYFEKILEFVFGKESQHLFDKSDDPQASVLYKPFTIHSQDKFDIKDRERFFEDRQRIEIVYEILQKAHNDPQDMKKRGIEALIEKGVFHTFFPLHDGAVPVSSSVPADKYTARQRLKSGWSSWKSVAQLQPLMDIREYFGEKIGFYFAFMDFYTKMLIFPAIFGLAAFIYGIFFTAYSPELQLICDKDSIPGKYWMCPICKPPDCEPWPMAKEGCIKYQFQFVIDNLATFALSCFMTAWSVVFLKMWKRRESRLAVDWETYDAEEYEKTVRPEYERRATVEQENPVTSDPEKIVPAHLKILWMTVSVLATVVVLIVDAISLLILVVSRIKLYGALSTVGNQHIAQFNVEYARWIIHGLILVMILTFEKFYLYIAHKLTSYECPKTDKQYMTSLLWKLFIFELLNDFIPIGYAAWMKQTMVNTPFDLDMFSELCDGGCIAEVAELIIVLLLARLIFGNILEVLIPYVKNCYHRRFQNTADEGNGKNVPQWFKDYKLNEVELDGVYEEYMEMMIQFAFIVLFIPAFPVASFVCLLNNILEIRIDASKLLTANRRPLPIRVPGVQIWNRFMDIIIKVGIVCSGALIALTSDNVPRLYFQYVYDSGGSFTGYTNFSLSSIEISMNDTWLQLPIHSTVPHDANITRCYYQDMRNATEPYNLKQEIWIINTTRAAVFASYCIIFFVFMWCVNTFVDDVPSDVKDRIRRHRFIIATQIKHRDIEMEDSIDHPSSTNATSSIMGDDKDPEIMQHYEERIVKTPSEIFPPIMQSRLRTARRDSSLVDDYEDSIVQAPPSIEC